MNSLPAAPSYRWLFWSLALLGLAGDQASKYGIFSHLYNNGSGGEIAVWPGFFRIAVEPFPRELEADEGLLYKLRSLGGVHHWPRVNQGALFGMGQGKNLFFGLISVVAALFIIGWSTRASAKRDQFLCVALGLILAGTLGNLYDRIVFEGVRDFFHWFKWYDWPVFNVADICLVTGAGLLLLEAFFRQPKESDAVSAPVSPANSPEVG
jgi:signal peptidase II